MRVCFMILIDLSDKGLGGYSSDGKIDITETLIQNPDDDKPDEIIRSSYLTHQNHDKISPPEVGPSSSASAIPKPRASSDQADDKPIRSSAGKSNMIADEDYNIVLEFEPEDKSKKRFKVVLTPNDNIHRALPPATTAPLGMKIITKWRDAVDPDISRDNKGKKRQMDSDVAELDIDLHEQPLDMDMSKFNPPTSLERGKVEVHRNIDSHEQPLDMDMSKISPPTSFERGEVEEHRSKKHRVESETFEQVQGPSQRQLSTRKSARLQKGAARNDEEAKYREGRGASEKKRRGKK